MASDRRSGVLASARSNLPGTWGNRIAWAYDQSVVRGVNRSLAALVMVLLPVVAGCSSISSTPHASGHATNSISPASHTPGSSGSSPSPAGWNLAASFGAPGAIETVNDLIAWHGGFVAVGTHFGVPAMEDVGPVPAEGRVWGSADGRSWEDITPPETFADAELSHVFSTTDGALIALARVVDGYGTDRPLAWQSADGNGWIPIPLGLPEGSYILDLARGARGYLALVSSQTAGGSALWLSADGQTWEAVRTSGPALAERSMAIGAGDDGFAALGTRGEGDVTQSFAVASSDGRRWIDAAVPPGKASIIAARGGDWVAGGVYSFGSTSVLDDEL